MRSHQMFDGSRPTWAARGFSLVEVTLALGILAFCMIPLLGLLPTGLNAQQGAQERARATTALNMLATAVRSAQLVSQSNGKATYQLPLYFSDSKATPVTPITFTSGDLTFTAGDPPSAHSSYAFQILDDGTIRKVGDPTPARETMYVQITPPATDAQLALTPANGVGSTGAVSVYAVVAWPVLPTDTATMSASALTNRQGSVESFITYVPSH